MSKLTYSGNDIAETFYELALNNNHPITDCSIVYQSSFQLNSCAFEYHVIIVNMC